MWWCKTPLRNNNVVTSSSLQTKTMSSCWCKCATKSSIPMHLKLKTSRINRRRCSNNLAIFIYETAREQRCTRPVNLLLVLSRVCRNSYNSSSSCRSLILSIHTWTRSKSNTRKRLVVCTCRKFTRIRRRRHKSTVTEEEQTCHIHKKVRRKR